MDGEKIDNEVEIMFTVPGTTLVRKSNCRVSASRNFNRRKMPRDNEQKVDMIWTERCKTNSKLFNGTKFRIHSVNFINKPTEILTVYLGITDYKDFLGTNWSPEAKNIQNLGLRHFNNSQAYLSDALGVGALVLTSDNFVILIRRSADCAEAACLWDVPGGHAEPKELVGNASSEEIDPESMSPDAIVDEIYDSIVREVIDEVNIPKSSLTEPELLGIARNNTSAGRPSVEFFIRCSLASGEVLSLYQKGSQAEADESTGIKFVALDTVPGLQSRSPGVWKSLAPSAKGCLTLYRQHMVRLQTA